VDEVTSRHAPLRGAYQAETSDFLSIHIFV
jgi:hypothetical protein